MIENPDINECTQTNTETEPTWLDNEELEAQHKKHQIEIKESRDKQEEEAGLLAQQLDEKQQGQQVQDTVNPELEKGKKRTEKDEYNHIKKMVLKNDIEWILKHIWFNSELLLKQNRQLRTMDIINNELKQKITSLWEPKNLQENDIFIKNNNETEIINETQNGYNQLYKKFINIKEWNDNLLWHIFLKLVKNLSKEIAILEKNGTYSKLYKKIMCNKITKNIFELKKAIKNKNHDLEKNMKRLKKYENWEYIIFPKWFIYELNRWPAEEWNVIIWENEYYVSTHIEKNKENKKTEYIKYVNSLKKAREFFKKNNIDIKYCRRSTRLANRKFIEAFEEKRKKRMWKKYKKSNILQVLEQTEKAIIFEEDKEIKKDRPNTNPIRFIDKSKKDLYKFATGDGKDLFHECVMWLDLDKL